jgi:tetratricopeptide (TPR) repeat protein
MTTPQIEQLRCLPQRLDEVWQGGLVRMNSWVMGEGRKPYRPWAALWIAVKAEKISPPDICMPDEVDFARVVDCFVKFANEPGLGGYRPGRVEVRDSALAEHLQGLLDAVGIAVECRDNLPALDSLMAEMAEGMAGRPLPPGALSGKGVTIERMRSFADAAKAFYEAAPWNGLTDEDLIHIESPKPPPGMHLATVLGVGGHTFGLGFFAKPEECWTMRRVNNPGEWFASRKKGVWSLTFGSITELPFGDADLWEDHGLPVAGDAAYPCAVCYTPRGAINRPDAPTLTFLEGLLRALARNTEEQIDAGRWCVGVETAGGRVDFTLALPDLLNPPGLKDLIKRGFSPDRRAMEQLHGQMDRFLADKNFQNIEQVNAAIAREFMGKPADSSRFPPRTALEQAQELCYQAFESIGRRQLQLARQALAICPDCADAYVLLAERTSDITKAAELYAQGAQAGGRALGRERFEKDVGHFWGLTDTRPYMRARLGLARCLEQLGRFEEAVNHYRELLRLNPGDNQGVRYLYLPLLLKLGRDAEAARFMKDSEDEPTANWTYTRALLAYRLGGACSSAQMELRKALQVNPHVVAYLLADEEPDTLPESYALGSQEEAMICAAELRAAFAGTPGAIEWLDMQAESLRRGPQLRALDQKRRSRERKRKRR